MIARVPVLRCPTCDAAYVLRWTLRVMTPGPPQFMYQTDCRHKLATPAAAIPVDELETAELEVLE